MKARHTPGPWRAFRNLRSTGCYVKQPKYNRVLARISEKDAGIDHEESEANADLMASAPDLLAACEFVVAEFENPEQSEASLRRMAKGVNMMRKATAKASGK